MSSGRKNRLHAPAKELIVNRIAPFSFHYLPFAQAAHGLHNDGNLV